ncbi:MAG: T9SS type A sorting domain-containing protein [Ignavibacteriales bacterium]|nr:T9SS type A sorting domain-containing protein [Ignavibacteriales bacterium]
MRTITQIFCTFLICMSTQVFSQLHTFKTENVFIVAIDGLRNNEGFESENLNLPLMWDSLRPQGTIYTKFFNTGITITNAGHSTIATGVRQILVNNCPIETLVRPKEPTIFEYYRKALDVPKEKTYFVNGKYCKLAYPVSIYPGFGMDIEPTLVNLANTENDLNVWDSTISAIDRDHPSLCYILFGQVDHQGHRGDTTKYLGAIRQADSLVFELWNKIQSDPVYANKTTMIVTSDHGRHDEQHGGWYSHGDYCHGCRHIIFLAIGPDIKTNTIIDVPRDQIDIAPTVGKLLGFSTPLAQGTVLTEMLTDTPQQPIATVNSPNNYFQELDISNSSGFTMSNSIAVQNEIINVVFSDNTGGENNIYNTRSENDGESWSTPQLIFTGSEEFYSEPVIISISDTSLFTVTSGYEYNNIDNTYTWFLSGIRSMDFGRSWQTNTVLDSGTTVSVRPSLSSDYKQLVNAVWLDYHGLKSFLSTDGGTTFALSGQITVSDGYAVSPSSIYIGKSFYTTWQSLDESNQFRDIWFDRKPWSTDIKITENNFNSYSYEPSLCSDKDSSLNLVYAHMIDAASSNHWAIYYTRSTDLGSTWEDAKNISGNLVSFSPIIKSSDNGNLVSVWASYSDNLWSIWGSFSVDGGSNWVSPFPITTSQNFSLDPDFSVRGDTLYLTWQDMRGGNMDIFFKKFVIDSVTDIEFENLTNVDQKEFSLKQNYPNPFNPSTVISYSLPQKEFVTIKVIDILGREVATLVNEVKPAGKFEVEFDASSLASGVYVYRIKAGSFTTSKKMLLTK